VILDLFAGPGGWDVGIGLLGLDAVGVEIDEWACATRSKAGLATIRADVSTLDLGRFTDVEGLIASPPCKDWSVAGGLTKKDGKTGWLVDEPPRYVPKPCARPGSPRSR
jgi:site-specific DNA-cytosine methylase